MKREKPLTRPRGSGRSRPARKHWPPPDLLLPDAAEQIEAGQPDPQCQAPKDQDVANSYSIVTGNRARDAGTTKYPPPAPSNWRRGSGGEFKARRGSKGDFRALFRQGGQT